MYQESHFRSETRPFFSPTLSGEKSTLLFSESGIEISNFPMGVGVRKSTEWIGSIRDFDGDFY